MEFIFYNPLFERIITIFLLVNVILTMRDDTKKIINEIKTDIFQGPKLQRFSVCYILICMAVFIFFIIKNKTMYTFVLILLIMYCLFDTVKSIFNNKLKLDNDDRSKYIMSTLIFLLFYSSPMAKVYFDAFYNCDHTVKEILAIVFISTKLIMFVFSLLINLVVILDVINKKVCKGNNKLLEKINFYKLNDFTAVIYDYKLSKKHKGVFFLIVDIIMFIITTPIGLVLTFIKYVIYNVVKKFILLIKKCIKFFNTIYLDRNKLIINIIKITVIISLTVTNIIVIWNDCVFSSRLNNIFTFISSVILIPLVYDQLKR